MKGLENEVAAIFANGKKRKNQEILSILSNFKLLSFFVVRLKQTIGVPNILSVMLMDVSSPTLVY